jgi:hypothetical protein
MPDGHCCEQSGRAVPLRGGASLCFVEAVRNNRCVSLNNNCASAFFLPGKSISFVKSRFGCVSAAFGRRLITLSFVNILLSVRFSLPIQVFLFDKFAILISGYTVMVVFPFDSTVLAGCLWAFVRACSL